MERKGRVTLSFPFFHYPDGEEGKRGGKRDNFITLDNFTDRGRGGKNIFHP